AQDLGQAEWVRRASLAGHLILIRHPKRGRKDRTLAGASRRSRLSRKHARQVREPWLLVAAPSLTNFTPRQIVRIYKTRMQIEENFRDTKSTRYGLGIARGRHTSFMRATNLLLLAALASFLLWLIGCFAKAAGWDRRVRSNSSSRQPDYSTLYLARLVIRHLTQHIPRTCLGLAGKLVPVYFQTVLDA
ncbi:MAG: transposase, partial [Gammaproteobacteria bacterium]